MSGEDLVTVSGAFDVDREIDDPPELHFKECQFTEANWREFMTRVNDDWQELREIDEETGL